MKEEEEGFDVVDDVDVWGIKSAATPADDLLVLVSEVDLWSSSLLLKLILLPVFGGKKEYFSKCVLTGKLVGSQIRVGRRFP